MDKSLKSAEIIIPLVNKIIKPKSVIDIGCGVGTWLCIFKKLGVKICGVDGNYVKPEMLLIDRSEFISSDLSQVIPLKDKFDLAISLEVAEHLPSNRAESFIKELCSLAPVILFSAAIPFQGGVNHINEQWQDYWVNLFKKNNYYAFDVIRSQVGWNENIGMHYRNNALVFCHKEQIPNHPELIEYPNNLNSNAYTSFSFVHPDKYLWQCSKVEKYKKLTKGFAFFTGILILLTLID